MSRPITLIVPLAVLCVSTFSGTNAGTPSPRASAVTVAGLIPDAIRAALSQAARLPVRSVPYEGSVGIMEDLRAGSVDVGAATSDASYLAFTGRINKDSAPFDALRGIIALDLKTIHLMVPRGSRASAVGDLKGFNVSLGPPGTGTALVAELLLDIHGVTLRQVTGEYLTNAEAVKRISKGTIDAAFVPLVAPAVEAATAAASGARFLEIEGPKVERLRLQHPFLLRTRLAQGTYPGQSQPVQTIAVDLLLVCRADMDERLVYSLLKTYFEERAKSTIGADLNRASAMSIPLHPGAARYYRERELSR